VSTLERKKESEYDVAKDLYLGVKEMINFGFEIEMEMEEKD
jgi:hypothetical protein